MPRSILLAALLAGLVLSVPSAAQVGSGKIVYASSVVYTVNPDGSGRTPITGPFYAPVMPQWSPDGRRIAFTASTVNGPKRLLVMDGDGSHQHEVATGNITLGRQPWSPDSARLSYLKDNEIYTASADGGDEKRLTLDGRPATAPGWSPAGSMLVYSRRVEMIPDGRSELFVIGTDGSGSRQITSGPVDNRLPSWSPSGQSLAFVRQETGGQYAIYVIRPDGTELHRLVGVRGGALGGEPVWSPDGAKVAYTTAHDYGYRTYGWPRWLAPPSFEMFSINADGANEQRLTEFYAGSNARSPVWSPDGERILFTRGGPYLQPWTMNSDGTCEEILTTDRATDQSFTPSWQPLPGGPSIGPKRCRAIAVEGSTNLNRGLSTVEIVGTITNEGSEPLTNVVLRVAAGYDLSLLAYPGPGCSKQYGSVVCRVPRIERGAVQRLIVLGQARRVGRDRRSIDVALKAYLHVSADGPLLATQRETSETAFTPGSCSARDRGGGVIEGTRFPDRICGRRGADDIHPRAGKDVIDAGAGPDLIFSKDEKSDVVTCGPGRDRVVADRKDKVARDCERVSRGR